MKKTIYLLLIAISFAACKKDDAPQKTMKKPLKRYGKKRYGKQKNMRLITTMPEAI